MNTLFIRGEEWEVFVPVCFGFLLVSLRGRVFSFLFLKRAWVDEIGFLRGKDIHERKVDVW